MMLNVPGMMWMLSLILVIMMICPQEVQALFGIPDFLEMGDCVTVPLKEDFDPVKYSGLWFDIESVPNEYQHTKKCITQNYTWAGDYMNVATRGLTTEDKKVRQGAIMQVEEEAEPKPNPAYMTVEAAGVPSVPYKIVSSDYRTYACVYSCLGYFGFRAEFFWVFSRTPTLPAEKIRLCHETLDGLKVDYKKMVPIVQGEPCPYNERLPDMLRESEQYLLKVLGPYVPTSVPPTPLPTTTTTERQSPLAVEEELNEIKEIVQEEKKIIQELEEKIVHSTSENIPEKTAKSSQQKEAQEKSSKDDDLNNSASLPSVSVVVLLLLTLFLTALPQH